ncbi:carboxymuconolactone decarboxylase family protein [Taibaiella soli]|uniref:Carboxymuconolactone decarboxylase family protein n=1 Tax=Taibaiella soli TaxID=1649169 RepID=A0A2W2ABM5_9BACT|nr:carboxymuconolactone decarboxylase family protein [Taibaiella soli]PZF72711.1 carboxymuconolactone decarboxylase family protein [Taibaiella soli]
MKKITVPQAEEVSQQSQELFGMLQKRIGKVPNLYGTIGYSAHALKGFLDFEAELAKGVFTLREREAVALAVSEINHCEYCLAAHSVSAVRSGFTLEETLLIRSGNIEDPKLRAIVRLAQAITETSGRPADHFLENFYNAGYNEIALMELVGLISVRVFTNYVYALTQVPIDFPEATPLN